MKTSWSIFVLLAFSVTLQGCPGDGGGGGSGGGGTFAIATTTAPFGIVGNPYGTTLTTTNGTAPFTWTLFGGTMPTGLTLSPAGTVTGTPGANGNFTPTFTVRDSTGKTAIGSVAFAVHARTDRVSVDSSGTAGNGASTEPVINSTDGRFIAFTSSATSLTPLPGGSGSQIFVHDRQTTLPALISRDSLGNAGNGASSQPAISADGRFVGFTSLATNFVNLVGASGAQVFLRDTQANQTLLVSRDTVGNAGNGASSEAAVSSTGQFVAFTSLAPNLAPIPGGSGSQIFLRDTIGNTTVLISQDAFGNAGNGASSQPAISADGRFVAFTSSATNLASLVGASGAQIFLRDTQSNQTLLVSRDTLGNAGNGASSQPAISADGRFVAFTSSATNLASLVGASGAQVFLRDTQANQTLLVSRDTVGNAGNGASSEAAVSSTGQFVAFTSLAPNLAPIPGGSGSQIFLRDTSGNSTNLVSQDTLGNAGNGASNSPSMTGAGGFVSFASPASGLVSGSSVGSQVYVRAIP